MNYNVLGQGLIALCLVFGTTAASAKVQNMAPRVKKASVLLSANQLEKLSPRKRAAYIRGVARMTARLEKLNPGLSIRNQKPKKFSWIEQLLGSVYASPSELRCIVGGFIIDGETCDYVTTYKINIPDEQGKPIAKQLSCGAGTALCNPMLYGIGSSGNGLCLPTTLDLTQSCEKTAWASGSKDETEKQVASLLAANRDEWNIYDQNWTIICDEKFDNPLVKNKQDLKNTCAAAKATKNKTAQAIAAYDKQSQPAQAEPTAATPEAEVASEIGAGQGEGAAGEGEPAFEEGSAQETAAAADDKLCENIELSKNADHAGLKDAACLSCAIQANQRKSGNKDFKISQKWMALLAASAEVCQVPLADMVQEFGYCEEKEDWKYTSKDMHALQMAMELDPGRLVEERGYILQGADERTSDLSIGVQHHTRMKMLAGYGFNQYFIPDLFCGKKEQLREKLGKMNSADVKTMLASHGVEGQLQALDQFTGCAKEAIMLKERKNIQSFETEYYFSTEKRQSSHAENGCENEAYDNFRDAKEAAERARSVAIFSNNSKSCQVILGDGDRTATQKVLDLESGKVAQVANSEVFNNENNSYEVLACDASRGYSTHNGLLQGLTSGKSGATR